MKIYGQQYNKKSQNVSQLFTYKLLRGEIYFVIEKSDW